MRMIVIGMVLAVLSSCGGTSESFSDVSDKDGYYVMKPVATVDGDQCLLTKDSNYLRIEQGEFKFIFNHEQMPTPPFLNNVDANGNIIFYIEILNEATNIREWISGDGSLTEGGEWESSLGCYGDWTLIRGPDL